MNCRFVLDYEGFRWVVMAKDYDDADRIADLYCAVVVCGPNNDYPCIEGTWKKWVIRDQ